MIVTFLGTAAANAFPEAFCRCKNCNQARAAGERSLRKRSSLLINDDLLVDLGPDIMAASQIHGCPLTNVHYCLQTHPHADHLDLSHLLSRSPEYGVKGAPVLHLFASSETLQCAAETFIRDLAGISLLTPETENKLNLRIHSIKPYEPFGFGKYRIIAFPANHAHISGAVLYSIEEKGQTIFYGTDTAVLLEQTWDFFIGFICILTL